MLPDLVQLNIIYILLNTVCHGLDIFMPPLFLTLMIDEFCLYLEL